LDEVAEVIFQVGEWPREIIICLLDDLKNYIVEDDEAMFQGVERPSELIFCILAIQKKAT
jgi:hypothetical protein